MVVFLANGNLLLEGLTGLAKTRAIKSLFIELKAALSRIQFTQLVPDCNEDESGRQHLPVGEVGL